MLRCCQNYSQNLHPNRLLEQVLDCISKGIVEGHGGKIWAHNNSEGKGATFTFSIPLIKEEEQYQKQQQLTDRQ